MSSGNQMNHPESMIRIASAVHRFRCPEIVKVDKLSFEKAFKTTGSHPPTKALMSQADENRKALSKALSKGTTSASSTIVSAAQLYLPLIQQILLSCEVQPEMARLDVKLVFEWSSGIEKKKNAPKFEAIMYDFVMTMISEAMGLIGMACDDCTNGDFTSASKRFRQAAGIMQNLSDEQLPKWISRGSGIDEDKLPSESTIGVCESLKILFLAMGQQMAVGTVLTKPDGSINYSLISKMTLGVAEQYELFLSTIQSKAPNQQAKMDPEFFKLISMQIPLQRALSHYFQARMIWDENDKYGIAIAMLREALVQIKPIKVDCKSAAKTLKKDLSNTTTHITSLLKVWEKDNAEVYFESVPGVVPESKRLSTGIMMTKAEDYVLATVEPALLAVFAQAH